MKRTFVFIFICLTFSYIYAAEDWQKFPIGPFSGMNNRDNSYTIQQNQSPDLLNVELTPGGKSVKKRKGYGIAWTLSQTTSPVHGVYDFFDANGNEVSMFFNDTKITSSVGGAAATVLLSTGPNGATYQCTDSLGQSYCANSSRTTLYKISGSTLTQIQSVSSTGTMVATAVTRLAMAGFSDAPSRIDFSAETDFTSWGTGSLGTSPYQFTINSPGSKITHIVYAFNRLMWFKDTSFGYILLGTQPNQSDWVVKTVAFDVGTNDNTSVYREGLLYFRGKDGHIYVFDGYSYQRLSREISGTVATAQTRAQNSWTQTSQADFQSGLSTPTPNLSMTISPGSVVTSSYSITETSSTQFSSGNLNSVQISSNNQSILLATTSTNMFNSSFESGTGVDADDWTEGGTWQRKGSLSAKCGTVTPYDGSFMMVSTQTGFSNPKLLAEILASSDNSSLVSSTITLPIACSWSTGTLTGGSAIGKRVKFRFTAKCDTCTSMVLTTTSTFILGGDFTFRYRYELYSSTDIPPTYVLLDYLPVGISTVTSGNYVSQVYDSGVSSSVVQIAPVSITSNTNTISFGLKTSASSNGSYTDILTATGTNAVAKRYIRYVSSFTLGSTDNALSSMDDVTFLARSSGSYYSSVNNAPNITSWDSFNVTSQDNGGSHTFYVRSSTGSFATTSTFPWTSISAGAIPTVGSSAFFQMRDDFGLTVATHNPSLDSFSFNWFEGAASDKSYATYFDDKIMFSVTLGTAATTNNRVLIYDMLNQTWLIWDLASNGFYVKANKLYFGSASSGYVFKHGDIDNDNGAAINSYWKSKDFFGGDPFTTQELTNISLAAREVDNSTATITYTTNGSSSAVFNFPLASTKAFVGLNKNLPAGIVGSNFNVKVGNNAADQPWEIFGVQVGIRPRSWVPGQQ